MNPDEVTAQILGAWDEIQEEEETPALSAEDEPKEDEQEGDEEPDEESDADSDDEGDEEKEAEDEEEDEGEQEEEESVTAAAFDTDDPEIQAFLAKYGGDLGQALRGATELQRVIGRQGSEKAALAQRVQELETAMEQERAFNPGVGFLTPEQQQWVEEAVVSGNPVLYVQRATQEGEFDLARAVLSAWGQEQPFEALRIGNQVDQIERQARAPQPQPVDTGVLLDVLAENFPDMRAYEAEMVNKLSQWGPGHPLVIDAKSGDVQVAARAIIAIYEAARASSTSVRTAREGIKRKNRQEADDMRGSAVVSSASPAPSASETPRRQRSLMPGLTLEQLDAEFAQ